MADDQGFTTSETIINSENILALKNGQENTTSEMFIDEDTKYSTSSSNSEDNINKKEDYEDAIPKDETSNELEVYDSHMSDDFGEDEGEAELDFSETEDSVLSQLASDSRNRKIKKRKPMGPFNDLLYVCEWKNCNYETKDESKFHVHVSYHIPDVAIKTMGNGEEVYMCLWAECTHLTGGVQEIQRHVTYHSYHTKLKSIGKKVMEEWNLPKCMFGSETRNLVPEKIDNMVCEWKDCNKVFNNVQVFLHHIQMHVNECFIDFGSNKEKIRCKWTACQITSSMRSRTRLTDHMRTHTKEKVVGCPVCGQLFATNTKLNDHCSRQLPNGLSEFQCTHCYKYFPNLRLLKDHMRGHVNFYKCCYCDMTCSSRHTYSAHIRYKHLDCKPFKCNMCDYTCKTQNDLKMHVTSHDPKAMFSCEMEGCEFKCRSKRTLQSHMIENHQISDHPTYCCHLPGCNSQYRRGCYLTKHLMTKHCLRWPSGHSKFMYHIQEDGTYKLQTVRYESVKLYGENTTTMSPSKANYKVTTTQANGCKAFKVSAIEPDSSSGVSQVFISIEDESGNTINCCTAPEVVGDKIPKLATVIATADSSPKCGNKSP